jgi:hypothetical protein
MDRTFRGQGSGLCSTCIAHCSLCLLSDLGEQVIEITQGRSEGKLMIIFKLV